MLSNKREMRAGKMCVLSVREENREGVYVGRIRKINKRVKRVRQTLNAGGEVLHYHNMLLFLSCPFLQIYSHSFLHLYTSIYRIRMHSGCLDRPNLLST